MWLNKEYYCIKNMLLENYDGIFSELDTPLFNFTDKDEL